MPKSKGETSLRSQFHRILRTRNALIVSNVPTKYSRPGAGDALCIHRSWNGYLESKVFEGSVRKTQVDFSEECRARGFPYVFIEFPKGVSTITPETEVGVTEFVPAEDYPEVGPVIGGCVRVPVGGGRASVEGLLSFLATYYWG